MILSNQTNIKYPPVLFYDFLITNQTIQLMKCIYGVIKGWFDGWGERINYSDNNYLSLIFTSKK
jgi:hypothetical protein